MTTFDARSDRWRQAHWLARASSACLLVVIAGGLETATAQTDAETRRPLDFTLSTDVGFARYGGDASGTWQGLTLYVSRRGEYTWRFGVGHSERFGAEGYGFGIGYSRNVGGFRLSAGVGSGTNVTGLLYPKYQLSFSVGKVLLRTVVTSVGYTRRQSEINRVFSDRVGASLLWYAPGPWILGGYGRYSIGHPGETPSWGAGGGLSFVGIRRMSFGFRVGYGDGSYLLLPSHREVDFTSWSYGAHVSRRLSQSFVLGINAGHSDYYGGGSVGIRVSKSW